MTFMIRIKSLSIVLFLSFVLCSLFSSNISAGGLALPNRDVQIAQTEQKAAIIFDGKTETMYESFTFNVNPITVWTYAWLIAVPTKPDVTLIKDDLFPKLDTLTKRTVYKNNILQKALFFDIEETNIQSEGIFSRPIDFTRFDIIEPPDQVKKLEDWLTFSSYLIPKSGMSILKEYQEKNWYFIIAEVNALHIQTDASESLTIPGAHTLPIKITFPTDTIIYPQKLTSIQPDFDSKDITLGYRYGIDSQTVLGAKDEKVDGMLSDQSKNAYAQLPLDYSYLRTDLFVFSDSRMMADGFFPLYANTIDQDQVSYKDFHDTPYFSLPTKTMRLTHLQSYKPMMQLSDVTLTKDTNQKNVNSYSSLPTQYIKVFAALLFIALVILVLLRRKKS